MFSPVISQRAKASTIRPLRPKSAPLSLRTNAICGIGFPPIAAPSGHYSVISCFDIIEHFPKEQGYELLREIYRILKPGGILLTKTPNAYTPWGMAITYNDLTHDAAYTESTLLQMASLAGFSGGDVREAGPVPFSVAGTIRTVLWRLIRLSYQFVDIVETGRCRSRVYTRVFFARLVK